ncbi:hypothetical protein E4U24_001947, partial [Claviceps purpurea]
MGNNHSSAAKSGSSGSTPAAPSNDAAHASSTSSAAPTDSHSNPHPYHSPHHHHLLPHRQKDARINPAAAHATHGLAAPPEPSLAQATGSTFSNRRGSLP